MKTLKDCVEEWYGKGVYGGEKCEISTLVQSHYPDSSKTSLLEVGLLKNIEDKNICIPWDTPAEIKRRPMSGRWEESEHIWISITDENWRVSVPLFGEGLRGGVGDTTWYIVPNGIYVDGREVGCVFRGIIREEKECINCGRNMEINEDNFCKDCSE